MGDHSILAPSGASVWSACPGSIALRQPELEDRDNTVREEGTACHELAAALLLGQPEPTVASNGVAINDEMRAAAKLYVDTIREVTQAPCVERRTPCSAVHPECFGTVDAYAYERGTLYLWDLKYGFGFVDAFENKQLLCYASGLMLPTIERVVLTIVQPRPYAAVRRWTLSAEQLAEWTGKLAAAASVAMSATPEVRSGPHCKYCSARFLCPAARRAGLDLYEATCEAAPCGSEPEELAAYLQVIERAAEQIKYLQTGIAEQLTHVIKSGRIVPGYQLKSETGRLEWTASADEVVTLGKLCGVDLSKPPEPITPLQAKAKGLPETILPLFSERKPAGLKLVRQSEKSIRKVFES